MWTRLLFLSWTSSPPSFFFFFNDTATTEIYTLSLHDALPIHRPAVSRIAFSPGASVLTAAASIPPVDRKSTRLNSSHVAISYAVFCLKKKKKNTKKSKHKKKKKQPQPNK